jgi:hypothetical protein
MQWHTESQFLGPQGHRAQAVTVWSSRWLTRAWKNEDESCWGSCKICCKAKQSYHWPINHFVMPRPGKVGACWSMLEQVVGFQTWGIAQLNMSHGVLALSARESVCLRKQWLAKAEGLLGAMDDWIIATFAQRWFSIIVLHLLPSGKHTKSYWKWPFIVELTIKNCDFP